MCVSYSNTGCLVQIRNFVATYKDLRGILGKPASDQQPMAASADQCVLSGGQSPLSEHKNLAGKITRLTLDS